jgi:putative SOS response-associated peptidase YedK
MCGRYLLDVPASTLAALYAAEDRVGDLPSRFNVAPGDRMPVVTLRGGQRTLELATWGLARPGASSVLCNARIETAASRPTFAAAVKADRCVVPASGFYEWLSVPDADFENLEREPVEPEKALQLFDLPAAPTEPKKAPKVKTIKQPWCFSPLEGVFAFAGLRIHVPDDHGQAHPHYVIVTTTPNELVADVHDRMPAALVDDEAIERWLDRGIGAEALDSARDPYPARYMQRWPVSRAVNNARNEGPELALPAV